MVWFTVGTLRELGLALKDLRSALEKRGLLDSGSVPWVTLRELEARWDRDKFFRKMRNVAAFHIDKKIIDAGLTNMLKDSGVVPFGRRRWKEEHQKSDACRNAGAPRRIVEQSR